MHWRCIECASEHSLVKWSPHGRAYIATLAARRCIGTGAEQATQLQAAAGPAAVALRTVIRAVACQCFGAFAASIRRARFWCEANGLRIVCVCLRVHVGRADRVCAHCGRAGRSGWVLLVDAQIRPPPPPGSVAPPPLSEDKAPQVLDQYIGERIPLSRHSEHFVHAVPQLHSRRT
jgi:hypothetical protein